LLLVFCGIFSFSSLMFSFTNKPAFMYIMYAVSLEGFGLYAVLALLLSYIIMTHYTLHYQLLLKYFAKLLFRLYTTREFKICVTNFRFFLHNYFFLGFFVDETVVNVTGK
jgi:hypothetical protein